MGAWQGALLGLFSILILTPCFGFLPLEIPFEPQEFNVSFPHPTWCCESFVWCPMSCV